MNFVSLNRFNDISGWPVYLACITADANETLSYVYKQEQGKHNRFGESAFSKSQVRISASSTYSPAGVYVGEILSPSSYDRYERGNTWLQAEPHPIAISPSFQRSINTVRADIIFGYWYVQRVNVNLYILFWYRYAINSGNYRYGRMYVGCETLNYTVRASNIDDAISAARTYLIQNYTKCSVQEYSTNAVSGTVTPGSIPDHWRNKDYVMSVEILARAELFQGTAGERVRGEALLNAVNNAQTSDVINLENVISLIGSVRDFPQLPAHLIKKISKAKSAKQMTKLAADAKLSYDYSVRATAHDIMTLKQELSAKLRNLGSDYNLARGSSSTSRSSILGGFDLTGNLEHHYKLYYGSVDQSTLPLYRALQNIGLDPSFEHVWNVVPYSFVVDWIYPVQTILQQMDYDTNVATLPVLAVTHGQWETYSLRADGLQVDISTYNRDLAYDMPSFPHFLPLWKTNMNWFNAGALLIQRLR